MGFSGLSSVYSVDGASDFAAILHNSIQERFKQEIEVKGNQYNPPGFVNILLVLKEEPHLAQYLTHSFVKRLNGEIEFYGEGNYEGETEDEYVALVKNFRNNKTIKKVLKSFERRKGNG